MAVVAWSKYILTSLGLSRSGNHNLYQENKKTVVAVKIFLYSDATLQCVRQFYVELTGLRKDRQCVNGLPTFPRCPLQNIHGGGGKEEHNKPFVNISQKKNVKLGDRFLSLTIDMFVRKLCRSLLNNTTQRIAAIARRISMGTVIEQRTLKQ